MSDNPLEGLIKPPTPEEMAAMVATAKAPKELTITYDPVTQAINLHGPLENRLLCYGMLMFGLEILIGRGVNTHTKSSILTVG